MGRKIKQYQRLVNRASASLSDVQKRGVFEKLSLYEESLSTCRVRLFAKYRQEEKGQRNWREHSASSFACFVKDHKSFGFYLRVFDFDRLSLAHLILNVKIAPACEYQVQDRHGRAMISFAGSKYEIGILPADLKEENQTLLKSVLKTIGTWWYKTKSIEEKEVDEAVRKMKAKSGLEKISPSLDRSTRSESAVSMQGLSDRPTWAKRPTRRPSFLAGFGFKTKSPLPVRSILRVNTAGQDSSHHGQSPKHVCPTVPSVSHVTRMVLDSAPDSQTTPNSPKGEIQVVQAEPQLSGKSKPSDLSPPFRHLEPVVGKPPHHVKPLASKREVPPTDAHPETASVRPEMGCPSKDPTDGPPNPSPDGKGTSKDPKTSQGKDLAAEKRQDGQSEPSVVFLENVKTGPRIKKVPKKDSPLEPASKQLSLQDVLKRRKRALHGSDKATEENASSQV